MVIPTETPSVMLRIVPLSTRLAELLLASIADMLLLLPMVIPTEMLTVTEATTTVMEIATAQAITTLETIMEAATITAHLPADTARRPSASVPTTPSATPPQEQLPLRNATLGMRRFARSCPRRFHSLPRNKSATTRRRWFHSLPRNKSAT